MNDRRLESLLRMAHEAAELEDGAVAPTPLPIPLVSWRRVSLLAGLAAALAMALVVPRLMAPSPAPVTGGDRVAVSRVRTLSDEDLGAVQRALAEMIAAGQESVPARAGEALLLSIVRGEGEACGCVNWRHVCLPPGKELTDLSRDEVIRLGLGGACADHAGRLLIVAVSSDEMPLDASTADQLARCLAGPGEGCGDVASCYASAAMACLPADATVIAETLAMAR